MNQSKHTALQPKQREIRPNSSYEQKQPIFHSRDKKQGNLSDFNHQSSIGCCHWRYFHEILISPKTNKYTVILYSLI
jgi:hypothetical protein